MIGGRAALASVVAALLLAGCETTEQESARLGKSLGHQNTAVAVTRIDGTDPEIRVDKLALVSSGSATAAVIEVTNRSATAQADLPILITVSNAAGKPVYSNETVGTSSPSGELSFLPAHATEWWVDSNVLSSGGAAAHVAARIGKPATAAPASAPGLSASHLSAGSNFVGPLIGGTVTNGSSTAQNQLTIYAVALAGGHVVAAGQSAVATLGAHASASFQVTVVGRPKGATTAVTVVPAHIG